MKGAKHRTDHGDGRDKEIRWRPALSKENLSTADLAPFGWQDVITHHRQHGGPVLISKGELKVLWCQDIGLQAISIHEWNDRLAQELLALGRDAVLVPDCDLADLRGWYTSACKALPHARHLLTPGADWANPPKQHGVGLDDWLQTNIESVSSTTATDLLAGVTDQPWQPADDGDDAPVDQRKLFEDLRSYALELLQEKVSVLERTALIRAAAHNCGFSLRDGEIFAMFAEARRTLQGKASAAGPEDEFDIPDEAWVWDQVVASATPNLVVALQKVGKTALIAGMISAWHYGTGSFLGLQLNGPCPPVIIAGTDQTIADWCRVLAPAGLMQQQDNGKWKIAGPIKRLWHRSQPVYFDLAGIEEIAEACKQHPGALLICDTYAALVAPLGLDEAKPEAAEPLYNLMEVIEPYNVTPILIHHASKSRANERASNASRNSNAIPAAVSQIISLQWLEPDKKTDQRILLTTEGRNSKPVDLVIEQVDRSQWTSHGSSEDIRHQQKVEKVLSNLTERQSDSLQVVVDRWQHHMETTAQDLQAALPAEFDDERKARSTLQQLFAKHLLEKRTPSPEPASPDEPSQEVGRSAVRYRPAGDPRARRGVPRQPPKPPKPPVDPPNPLSEPTISLPTPLLIQSKAAEVSELSEAARTSPCAREEQPITAGTPLAGAADGRHQLPPDGVWFLIAWTTSRRGDDLPEGLSAGTWVQAPGEPHRPRQIRSITSNGSYQDTAGEIIPLGPGWFRLQPAPSKRTTEPPAGAAA